MALPPASWRPLLVAFTMFCAALLAACDGAREETVAGLTIPVPRGMARITNQGIEVSIPGFGGGQAAFQGDMALDKIIEFYKQEMPARGWQAGTSLLSRGGLLSYSKEGKTVILSIGTRNGKTILSVTVGNSVK